jgi:hypothetical protein
VNQAAGGADSGGGYSAVMPIGWQKWSGDEWASLLVMDRRSGG